VIALIHCQASRLRLGADRSGTARRFERTWDFDPAFCEAASRRRALREVQLTFERPGTL
jgi:hypothetical protein